MIRLLIDWLADWLNDWLADWMTDWLTDWLISWLTDWLADWLTDMLTDWLTDWLIRCLHDWTISLASDSRLSVSFVSVCLFGRKREREREKEGDLRIFHESSPKIFFHILSHIINFAFRIYLLIYFFVCAAISTVQKPFY